MASALISSVFAQKKNPLRVHAKEAGGVKTKVIFLIDVVVFFYSPWMEMRMKNIIVKHKDFYNKHSEKNKGSAVVEATLIMPIFLFAMLAVFCMCRCKLAEGVIYEAAVETAEYMAEYAYVSDVDTYLPRIVMPGYIDNKELVEKSVEGGINGIDFLGTVGRDGNDYVVLHVNYNLNIDIPFIPKLAKKKQIVIKQRAYIGEGENKGREECKDEDRYVYVTDNRDVYHESRNCTHLKLSIHTASCQSAKANGYTACEFCGNKCSDTVYVTDEGRRYHSNKNCSGLKRTVYRVKLSDVGDLPGCSRCSGE